MASHILPIRYAYNNGARIEASGELSYRTNSPVQGDDPSITRPREVVESEPRPQPLRFKIRSAISSI